MTLDPEARHGLALVGARGTGKTTVGRLVAERVGHRFVDLDEMIELRMGMPIRECFASLGEHVFRLFEAGELRESSSDTRIVLATGGGIVLSEANRKLLREFGCVVWLTTDPEVLAARLESDAAGLASRPALTPAGTLAEIAEVLAVRTPLYREVAHAVVDTTGRTPDEVADAVLDVWPRGDGSTRGAP
jgi:shikimate kinase